MDDVRVGRICRALRRRLGWRQADVARRAGCDQKTVSLIERGQCAGLRLGLIREVFRALGASFDGTVGWRAGDLDRLVDQRHASIVEALIGVLRGLGWDVIPELSYSEWGERGSIDVFAWWSPRRAIAVFEVKTELTAIGDTVRKHDEKTRLASDRLAFRRTGWRPTAVGKFLVIGEDRTSRRRVAAHERTFTSAYPMHSRQVRAWLQEPRSVAAGVWFLTVRSSSPRSHRTGGPRRVRVQPGESP